jgi:UDP-GlcNAc3NAcA epimerase
MSRLIFEQLGLPEPGHHLQIGSGSHGKQLGEMVKRIEEVLLAESPAGMVVYGDTNSTLAGALAAVKLHVPVAHVEAGLRSFNRRMPEEINRVLTDHASELLLAPTSTAVTNLAREGITRGVHHTGDVMCDVLEIYRPMVADHTPIARWGVTPGKYLVATVHRAENTDDPALLGAILQGLGRAPVPVIFPVHPRTRGRVQALGLPVEGALRVIDPVGYVDMLRLMRHAAGVFTDSGGLQKEAYFLGVPCVTMRGETEWVETVTAGWNRLLPPNGDEIARATGEIAAGQGPERRSLAHEYGTGKAGQAIASLIAAAWG